MPNDFNTSLTYSLKLDEFKLHVYLKPTSWGKICRPLYHYTVSTPIETMSRYRAMIMYTCEIWWI